MRFPQSAYGQAVCLPSLPGIIAVQASVIRSSVFVSAVFTAWLSLAMLLPAAVDLYFGNPDWQVFTISAIITGAVSVTVAMANRSMRPARISPRLVFLTVNLLWVALCVGGAVPLLAASLKLDFTDAMFESMSAVTTTGSTVLVGLDTAPPGILLWRSLLQWMGGLGVVALGVFLLPFLKIGGMTFFRVESSDIGDLPFARFSTFTVGFVGIYAALTAACAFGYVATGMSLFDAVNHAMTTISTGGYSTHDASFGAFDGLAVQWVAIIFMLLGGLPFSILLLLLARRRLEAIDDPQISVFVGYSLALSLIVAVSLIIQDRADLPTALTHATFNIVSVITTTGFASEDYSLWGPLAVTIFFVATFLGGCSGSTAGGIKSYRHVIFGKLLVSGLAKLIHPHRIASLTYGTRKIDDAMARNVLLFMAAFFLLLLLGTILLGAMGLDFVTALTGTLTALTNVGPGLGDVIGPAGNFSSLIDPAKWVLIIAMLLGRLEILAVLVLLMPEFWAE
jgi:trk system potassium uptake protein TrkH